MVENPETAALARVIHASLELEYKVMVEIVGAATVSYRQALLSPTWSLESSVFSWNADKILLPLFRIQVPHVPKPYPPPKKKNHNAHVWEVKAQ